MKRFATMLAITALMALIAGPIQAGPPHKQTGPAQRDDLPTYDCGDGTVGGVGDDLLWPPNHKFPADDYKIVAAADDGSDGVTLETRVDVFDAAGGDGGTNHDPDAVPVEDSHTDPEGSPNDDTDTGGDPESGDPDGEGTATTEHALRAERSGNGEGRTYTIEWEAVFTDENGSTICTSTGFGSESDATHAPFVVCVPHDMRPSRRDCVQPTFP